MSTLIQSGREEEAEALFEQYIDEKRQTLPEALGPGLDRLDKHLHEANIHQARLDWMWHITTRHLKWRQKMRRAKWDAKVRWGCLADQLIQDWLEANSDRTDEVSTLFHDLTEHQELLESLMVDRQGLVIASAHIGPLFVGPLILSEMGIENKWVAFLPRISSMSYANALISTGDQTGLEVIGAVYSALTDGQAVIIAVDGVSNPATPRKEFEGVSIAHSDFAARMSYRQSLPSIFGSPYWRDRKIDIFIEQLPTRAENESQDTFVVRWNEAYFDALRKYMMFGPENLGTTGGIWGQVR